MTASHFELFTAHAFASPIFKAENKPSTPSPRVRIDGKLYHHDFTKDFPAHPDGAYDGHRREWKAAINAIINR